MKITVLTIALLVSSFASFATDKDLKSKVESSSIKVELNETSNLESLSILVNIEELEEIQSLVSEHYNVDLTTQYGNESNHLLKGVNHGQKVTVRITEANNVAKVVVIANK